jgi:hypothetical protein
MIIGMPTPALICFEAIQSLLVWKIYMKFCEIIGFVLRDAFPQTLGFWFGLQDHVLGLRPVLGLVVILCAVPFGQAIS